ncbi:MAG: leucine-rich repeat protein [Christensenellaceae bacterium]|nr:leucine-rich repeat protein [Christensenellaceae bacterium]
MKTKRYSIIGLLCLVMVFALSMFFVACNKDDSSDSGSTEFTQTGVYYALSGEEEWELSITASGFTLKSASQSYSGNYTFNGSELALSSANGTRFAATLSGDGIKVTIDGKEYEFLKKFTVTFTYDGGSFTKEALSGKGIDAPENPVKEGYVFVGWYKDRAMNLPFDFKAGVKSDTTVYGKFVKQTEDEFNVAFYDDGKLLAEYSAKTVQHCLGTLPALTKEGKDFLGWWISDFEDSAKLTKKMNSGDEVKGDAKLFAVWANKGEKALGVTISVGEDGKATISWTSAGVGQQYTVTVTGPEGSLPTEKTPLTSLSYDFNALAAGEYEIVVMASNGLQGKVYFNNKGLPKVSGLEVSESDATLLVFKNVEGADYYLITIVCNNAGHVHSNVRIEKTATELVTYDFSGCEMTKEGITFYVTACSDKSGKSVVSELHVMHALDNIAEVKYDAATGKVSWTDVSAEYYYVTVDCGGKKISAKVDEANYSVGAYKGEIALSVTGYKKGYVSTEAKEASFTRNNLLMPEGLRISDGVLYWNPVEDAVSYEVKVNGTAYTNTNKFGDSYYFSLPSHIGGANEFTVSVKAIASDTTLNSAENEITVSKKAFTNVTYSNRVLTWSPVADATGYTLTVNGTARTYEARKDVYSYTFENPTAGKYTVKLTATVSSQVLDEKTIEIDFYSITFNSLGGDTDPVAIVAAAGDYVSLPEVTRTGYDFEGWYLTEEGPVGGKKYASDVFDGEENVVLYAYYVPKKHTVRLEVGEYGTLAEGEETVELAYGESFTLPVPTANNASQMAFIGWYKGRQGRDTRYTDQFGVGKLEYDNNEGMTLYAFWASVFKYEKTVTEDGTQQTAYRVKGGDGINFVTEVTIPESVDGIPVTTIDAGAFKNCSGLQVVNFYSSMEYVEVGDDTGANSAFEGCSNLTEINVLKSETGDKNKYYSAKGVLCGYSKLSGLSEVLVVPSSVSGTLELPEGVEVIKSNSFKNKNISTIIIPSTVQEIKESAFEDCKQLVNVIFRGSESANAKPLSIAKNAFKNCSSLQTVTFPARLSSFNRKAFESCTKLVSVDISKAEGEETEYYSQDGVLISGKYGAAKLEYVPSGIKGEFTIPAGVKTIASLAFSGSQLTKVIIPKEVTMIEAYAFGGVTNEDGKSYSGTIEGDFFAPSATRLAEVEFQGKETDSPLTIAEGAFYGTRLYKNEIVLPENLVSLGKYAFGGIMSTNISYANLSVRVETSLANAKFASGAFASYFMYNGAKIENYKVTKLTLGKNVPFMEIGGIFGNNIEEISVDEANPNYKGLDGVLFNSDYTMIVYFPSARGGEYVVPDTVTKITDGVFEGRLISKVVIPASVTEIGARAFYRAENLTEVEFTTGDTEADLAIGDSAFYACEKLTTINLPARLRTIAEYAFFRCDSLVEVVIPEGVTEIAGYAFAECEGLKTISLPASLKKLGILGAETTEPGTGTTEETGSKLTVFKDSNNIENITVAKGNTIMLSENGVLYVEKTEEGGNVVSELVYSPGGKTGELELRANLVKVWDKAFYYNTKLEKITFLDGERSDLTFGDSIFEGCWNLKELVLPVGLKKINYGLFDGCASLETITVPYTVESISYGAFRRYHSSISSAKEYGCENLKNIIFQEAPAGVTAPSLTIEGGAYKSSSSTLSFGMVGAFYGTSIESITLPARTVEIGAYAFAGVSTLKSVTIPQGVATIGQGAFLKSGVTDVVFEEGSALTAIPAWCFSETPIGGSETANGTISLPEGIKSIGYRAFYSCGALTSIVIPSTVVELGSGYYESDFYVVPNTDDEIVLNYKKATSGTNKVPVTTVTNPVGEVFSGKGSSTSNLATVTFAKDENGNASLEYIYSKAFYYSKIERIAIPASIKEIREEAFSSIKTLEEITFETAADGFSSITLISDKAFALGSDAPMTSFTFPETSQENMTLGMGLFSGCANLTTINLSNSVTSITGLLTGLKSKNILLTVSDEHPTLALDKVYPFVINKARDTIQSVYTQLDPDNEEGLVVIPEGYTTILPQAFMGQTKIKKIVLPSAMKKIGSEAFKGATGLTEVSFARDAQGKSAMSYMGIDVFMNCTNLIKAEIPGELGYVPDGTFRACSKLKEVTLGEGIKTLGRIGLTFGQDYSDNVGRDARYFDEIEYTNGKLITTQNYNGLDTYLFYNCTSLTTIKTKASDPENVATLPSSLESIGNKAFANTGLISVILPEKITTIGNPEYYQCKAGTTAPKKQTDNGYLFSNSKSLVSVYAKGNIASIGKGAFQKCVSFTTFKTKESDPENVITLPNGLKVLSNYAFDETGIIEISLKNVTLTTVGTNLFSNTTALERIDLGKITALTNYMFSGSGISEIDLTGVTSFGTNVFAKCKNLKELKLPSEITTLPDYAFSEAGLTKINLNNVTTLGKYTFEKCADLTEVIGDSNLKSIGNYCFQKSGLTKFSALSLTAIPQNAFDGCASLTEVTDTANIASVGTAAFRNSGVVNINLPQVTELGASAFEGCASLKSVNIAKPTTNTLVFGNTVFKNSTIENFNSDEAGKKIINLTGALKFGTSVFEGAQGFEKVIMPTWNGHEDNYSDLSAYLIPSSTFKNTSVVEVDMSTIKASNLEKKTKTQVKGNKAGTYQNSIFEGTANLERVILPEDLTIIAYSMFKDSGLKYIDLKNIVTINYSAFENCTRLVGEKVGEDTEAAPAEVKLNLDNVQTIGYYAFRGCTSLTEVNLPALKTLETKSYVKYNGESTSRYASEAFAGCTSLTKVGLNEALTEKEGSKVYNYIPVGMFLDCTSLTTLYVSGTTPTADTAMFSDKITAIGYSAFRNTGLKIVVIGKGVKEIGNYAFADCTSLETVEFAGDALTTIGDYAFSGDVALTTKELPGSVTTIGAYAFQNCSKLTGEVNLPKSLKTVGECAFIGTGISAYTNNNGNTNFTVKDGMLYSADGGTLLSVAPAADKTIVLDENTKIGSYAFAGANNLAFVFKEGFAEIADYAFMNLKSLTSVELPSTIATIGEGAFMGTGLTEVTLPASLTTLGIKAFANTAITSLTLPENVTSLKASTFEGYTKLEYLDLGSVQTLVANFLGNAGSEVAEGKSFKVIVPATVTKLPTLTFVGSYVNELVLNTTATSEATKLFAKASSTPNTYLKKVTLAEGIEVIPEAMFGFCNALETVEIPSTLTSIGKNAFAYTQIKSFVVPDSVTEIGQAAFSYNTEITSFTFGNGMTITGAKELFEGCSKLKTVVIPEGYTTITNSTFEKCESLTDITVPSTVTTLEMYAFYQCTALKSVVLSEECVVANYAFRNWTKGQTIYFRGTKAFAEDNWGTSFNDLASGFTEFEKCDVVYDYKG